MRELRKQDFSQNGIILLEMSGRISGSWIIIWYMQERNRIEGCFSERVLSDLFDQEFEDLWPGTGGSHL
jgi:hypothetical protein